MATQERSYIPLPPQARFHQSFARQRLYGGAAGGGKSKALRMEAARACFSAPGVKGLFLRRTYPEVEESVINPMLNELPAAAFRYNQGKHLMKFANKSTIKFGHCNSEEDVRQYQGSEWDFIMADELTTFTEFQYKYLTSRLRTTKINILPFFAASANPGGVGHVFVKRLWIDRQFDEFEDPEDFDFIPAKVYDNTHLVDNDPGYVNYLRGLPEKERRALLDGDWDVFAGQFFPEFRREIHVVDPYFPVGVKRRIIALDYGYFAPSCVLWMAQLADDTIVVYRELYETELTYHQLAIKINALTRANEKIDYIVADPSIINKRNEATATTGSDEFSRAGLKLTPADNNRIDGWATVRQALKIYTDPNTRQRTAGLKITSNCVNLIRTLPQMQHDKKMVEDLDTKAEDHACFIAGTFVNTMDGEKPIEKIREGDFVLTRKGYKRVEKSGVTGIKEVFTYSFSNGEEITCTPNHPFFVKGKGFLPIDSISYDDILQSCESESYLQPFKNSAVSVITFAVSIFRSVVSDYTSKFGKSTEGKQRKDFISITKMATEVITKLRIWKKSEEKNTHHFTQALPKQESAQEKTCLKKQFQQRERGMLPKQVGSGTASTVKKRGRIAKRILQNASSVAMNIKLCFRLDQNSAIRIVKREHYGSAVVFNLTVADAHEFFANGILIHNCDSCRYGLKELWPKLFAASQRTVKKVSGKDRDRPEHLRTEW